MKRFAALSAIVMLAGCSGLGSQVAPPAPGLGTNAVFGRQADGKLDGNVYVSDLQNGAVWICPANFGNIKDGYLTPTGQLSGVQNPSQLAVDSKGTVYVANAQISAFGAGSIAEYPRGTTSASITLSTDLNTTTGVAVDSHGNVFASNKYLANVVMFAQGKTAPSKTIKGGGMSGPDALAVDSADNLYIADSTANDVFEVTHGSTTPRSLKLKGLNHPVGIAVDSKNTVYVSNLLAQYSNVTVYKAGATKPTQTLVVPGQPVGQEKTIAEPAFLSVTKPGDVLMVGSPVDLALVSNEEYFGGEAEVAGYALGGSTPIWTNPNTTGLDAVFQPEK
jgi:hypothetical protein